MTAVGLTSTAIASNSTRSRIGDSCAVASAWTTPETIWLAKPGDDTTRRYGPDGTGEKENCPFASVATIINAVVPSCDHDTLAATMAAPVSSVTVPVMVPGGDWPPLADGDAAADAAT